MAQRLTQFARVMNYFRTADIEEAEAALGKAAHILSVRQSEPSRRPRKEKPAVEQSAAAANNG